MIRHIVIAFCLSASISGCAKEDERYKVPGLEKMLTDRDPDSRATAAQVLGSYGPEAKASVPLLANALLKDESATVRICVTYGLADIGPDAGAAADALVEAIAKDPDPKVRIGAAYALGTIRSREPTVMTALRKAAANDPDRSVREEAVRSREAIQRAPGQPQSKRAAR